MTQMNLPQLADVIVNASSARGRESAQYLLYEKLRTGQMTPAQMDETDEAGQTACTILARGLNETALDTLLSLVSKGATPPANIQEIFEHCFQAPGRIYSLLECWSACQHRGQDFSGGTGGNPLHLLARKASQVRAVVDEISTPARSFMHHWQKPFLEWMQQARATDGATPLHVLWTYLPEAEQGAYQWAGAGWSSDLRDACHVTGWMVQQGCSLDAVDKAQTCVAHLVVPHLQPQPMIASWLGEAVMAEIARTTLEHATVGAPARARARF